MSERSTPNDRHSAAFIGIDLEHHMLHEGVSFTAHYEHSVAGAGLEVAFGFATGLTIAEGLKEVHLIVDAQADDVAVLEIREIPTITLNQGTSYAPLNRHRQPTPVPSIMRDLETGAANRISTFDDVEANAADLSGGIILHHETIGQAANPVGFSAGKSRGAREFVLEPLANYVVILEAMTANATICNLVLNWYELEDRGAVH